MMPPPSLLQVQISTCSVHYMKRELPNRARVVWVTPLVARSAR